MTVLALKLCRRANAVSSLHGQVSRAMWTRPLSRRAARSRCRSATSPTACTSRPGWRRRCARSTTATSAPTGRRAAATPGFWEAIDGVDDGELWETHQTLKAQLIDFARRRAVQQARAPRRVAGVHRAAAPRAQPRRADDRLRPPVRHLQARQPAAAGPRGARRARQPPAACRCSSSSPARRTRTTAPARTLLQQIARLMQRPAVRRQDRCSSRTTTSTSAGTWCRASTSGSTTRAGRSRPAARADRRSC